MNMKDKAISFVILLILFFFQIPVFAGQEDETSDVFETNLAAYLSVAFLDSDNCEDYKAGEIKHRTVYDALLRDGVENFLILMDYLDSGNDHSEVQSEWLYSLIEDICRKHPQVSSSLIDDYPQYYALIAACRNEESLSFLADEASNLSDPSGLELLMDLFADVETKEDFNAENAYNLKLLLIYLAVDGEHIEAFKSLKEDYDEGLFYAASRLMELYDKPFTEKPFLSESYIKELKKLTGEDEDSAVFGMTIGDKAAAAAVQKRLLALDLADIPQDKIERYSLMFLWYLRLKLDSGTLDVEILKKYADFIGLNNIDSLPIRRALGIACRKMVLPAGEVCKFINENPKFKTFDPADICIYSELRCCPDQTAPEKGIEK
jgi:hypothetical protein